MADPQPSQPRHGAPGEAIEFNDATEPAAAAESAAPPSSNADVSPADPNVTPFPANTGAGAGFEIDWADEEQRAPRVGLISAPPPEPPLQPFEIIRDPAAPKPTFLPRRKPTPPPQYSPPPAASRTRPPFIVRFVWAFMPLILFLLGYGAVVLTEKKVGYAWDEAYYYQPAVKAGQWLQAIANGEQPFDKASIDRYWQERSEHPSVQKLLSGLALQFFPNPQTHLFAIRLPIAVLFGLSLSLLYLLGRRMLSPLPGVITAIMYATMPQIFGFGHFAVMETPLIFCMLLTVWCFLKGLDDPLWSIATGVSFGALLATKLNGFFLPIPLILWAHIYARPRYVNNLFAMLILGPVVLVGLWPWLWHDTTMRLLSYLAFHAQHQLTSVWFMGRMWGLDGPNAPWFYPWVMLGITTPLTTLLFMALGILPVLLRPHRRPLGALFLLIALVMIGVASLPGTPRYDGIRLFLPAYPFLALLGGAGFVHLLYWIETTLRFARREPRYPRRFTRVVAAAFALALCAEGLFACVRSYPYLLSYFNPLVGGLRGANARGYEVSYWNDALNEDVRNDLNALPSPGGNRPIRIRALAMHELCLKQLQEWGLLRPDIDFSAAPPYDYHLLQLRRGMFRRPEHALADTRFFPIVKTWGREGVPLLALYQTGPAFEQYWPTLMK